MISLKRYLDGDSDASIGALLAATLDAYRSALTKMGICAAQACPPVGQDLERTLTTLAQQLSEFPEPELVVRTEAHVEGELQEWGGRSESYLRQKTDEVKELLVVLARTASTLGASDERHTKRFDELTTRLRGIANLEDLGQVRTALVTSVTELESHVGQVSKELRASVTLLEEEVVTYQAKLEEAEELASSDTLTGLFNRRKTEAYIAGRIEIGQPFCVAMVDLNGFKQVNDQYGHNAGDALLKEFSAELRSNVRAGDLVGRWGGDEFLVVLNTASPESEAHVARIEKWILGNYTVESATGPQTIRVDASVGIAEWAPGETMSALIERADAAMYERKGNLR